jgi:hypothetical protein
MAKYRKMNKVRNSGKTKQKAIKINQQFYN